MSQNSHVVDQVINQMKEKAKTEHLQGLMGDIVEGCTPVCTRRKDRPVDEKCIEKCTSAYITSWNQMAATVLPKLKGQMGLQE